MPCGCRPHPKTNNATNDVGYSPFDSYDLGDKYQKGDVRTRFGSKDELPRLMAVLHAIGLEVIQDVVLNHADGADTTAGNAGQNPEPNFSLTSNSDYKTFHYNSFATPCPRPATTARPRAGRGRWPKNYITFLPNGVP